MSRETIQFRVRGSRGDIYRATFERVSESNLNAFCTCTAGENGQYCKHRFSILRGDRSAVVSDNAAEVDTVMSWLEGTNVEVAMQAVALLEDQMSRLKRELSAAKKDVARAMRV